jgi:hypothetical protein
MKNKLLGMTLMEVIASMFIVSIGLLGILMVIPYGAFQVSKARNAEYISNMLAAAAQEIKITEWITPITDRYQDIPSGGLFTDERIRICVVDPFVDHTQNSNFEKRAWDATNATNATLDLPIFVQEVYGSPADNTDVKEAIREAKKEKMRGKDDIKYTLKEDSRTVINDVSGNPDYSYFFTVKPRNILSDATSTITGIDFTTDLLGCYKRIDMDRAFQLDIDMPRSAFYLRAAKLTVTAMSGAPEDERFLDFSTTRYVFITWTEHVTRTSPPASVPASVFLRRGEWCRVVSVGKDATTNKQVIMVLANEVASIRNSNAENLENVGASPELFVFPGVLYHKRIY